MEKLLSKQLKTKNHGTTNLTSQRTKNIFFSLPAGRQAVKGYENIFLPTHRKNPFTQL